MDKEHIKQGQTAPASARRLFILCFADAVHLGPAFWTDTLACRPAILHFDGLSILHLPFGFTFHAITYH